MTVHNLIYRFLLPCGLLMCHHIDANATEPVIRDEIVAAFEYRMEFVKNLRFKMELEVEVFEDDHGQPGRLVAKLPVERFEYWQLGDSNRQDVELVNSDGSISQFASNFNALRGQGVTRSGGTVRPGGYIDSKRDPLMDSNRYRFWLNIRDWGLYESEYIFNYVLDRKDLFQVETDAESGLLKLTTDYVRSVHTEASSGKRILWLDPNKGYLPVKGLFEWQHSPNGRRIIERFEVNESMLVGDVWMPTSIKEHLLSSVHNIFTIRITEIEQGSVTPEELEIEFLPNTLFVDAIKGISFVGDEKGNPIGPVKPTVSRANVDGGMGTIVGQNELLAEGSPLLSGSARWQWVFGINAVVVASLGVIYCVRRFYSSRS